MGAVDNGPLGVVPGSGRKSVVELHHLRLPDRCQGPRSDPAAQRFLKLRGGGVTLEASMNLRQIFVLLGPILSWAPLDCLIRPSWK